MTTQVATNTIGPARRLVETDSQMMVDCIRLHRDCAKICYTTVSLIASWSVHAADVCKLCDHLRRSLSQVRQGLP